MFEFLFLVAKIGALGTAAAFVASFALDIINGDWGRRMMEVVLTLGALTAVCAAGMVLTVALEAG
jgi:hypothetical protein